MTKIIITDLTHFENKNIVCTAGICEDTGQCIRPMPYLKIRDCERLKILPGALLSGEFNMPSNITPPHTEDRNYQKLKYCGPCSPENFQEILENSLVESVCSGFGIHLAFKQKHIPVEHELSHSIVTLKISPRNAVLVEDSFNPGKIRLNFLDNDGSKYKFWSITDLGFYKYALSHITELAEINDFIHEQNELYLRVGLTREYKSPDGRNGYWLQINGIYTFPDYHKGIRSY
jgi:hypothetical protein